MKKREGQISYAVVFMAFFSRFFSLVFGGIDRQGRVVKLGTKGLGYFTVLGVVSMLVVIGVSMIVRQ